MTENRKKAVAVGIFDGIHAGHRAVIARTLKEAREHDLSPAAFTFKTETVMGKTGQGYIMPSDRKKELLFGMGLEFVVMPDFSDFKNMSAGNFVEMSLSGVLSAARVVCGEDFRFGKGSSCGATELAEIGKKCGIEAVIVSDVRDKNGVKVSSETIRELIRGGKIAEANFLLGSPFEIESDVRKGSRLGRTLNFPTINQDIPAGQTVPFHGDYETSVGLGGKTYVGITNIGVKPTVGGGGLKPAAETHILDFDGNVYGKTVRLSLQNFIRPERKFESLTMLADQIKEDILSVKMKH